MSPLLIGGLGLTELILVLVVLTIILTIPITIIVLLVKILRRQGQQG